MDKCSFCEDPLRNPHATGTCRRCRTKLGITAMPPGTRRALPCRCCNGMQFVRAIPREYTSIPSPELGAAYPVTVIAPMAVTYEPRREPRIGVFTHPEGYEVEDVDLRRDKACGLLEVYVCTACGYVEWFCAAPTEIPIGPQYMTELVDYGDGSPYR